VDVFSILRVMTMEFGRCDSHMIDRRWRHKGELEVELRSSGLFLYFKIILKNFNYFVFALN
jgi:hypothetical protein